VWPRVGTSGCDRRIVRSHCGACTAPGRSVSFVSASDWAGYKPRPAGVVCPGLSRTRPLYERLNKLLDDHVSTWVFVAVVTWAIAFLDLWRWYFKTPVVPAASVLLAILVSALSVWRILNAREKFRRLKLGLDGERMVGEYLEHHRPEGYRVFHDVCEDGYNIDHVLIGPAGVFAIETKTISKPEVGTPLIEYDGERVTVGGSEPERDPIAQVRAGADRIAEVLQDMTGTRPFVRPVVLYPGWFVRTRSRGAPVWVLNPRALPKFLIREKQRLSTADVALYASRLMEHIRRR
jgi:hypothetical protein